MFQDAICIFVNDNAKAEVISKLAECGIRLILLRCAGFNNVDIAAANDSKMKVMRVPRYSPNAVAEHAVALMMMLTRQTTFPFNELITPNRNLHKTYFRVKNYDFRKEMLHMLPY